MKTTNKAVTASAGKLASCGHLVWSGDRCATMTCPNYVNKQSTRGKGKKS